STLPPLQARWASDRVLNRHATSSQMSRRTGAAAGDVTGLRGEDAGDRGARGGQQVVDFRDVPAAGFREVGAAAATPADDGSQFLHQLTRLEGRRQVLADRHEQLDLALVLRGQHDNEGKVQLLVSV